MKYGNESQRAKWSSRLELLDLIDDEPSGENWGQKKIQELDQGIIDCNSHRIRNIYDNSSLEYSL